MLTITASALVEVKNFMELYEYEDCCYYIKITASTFGFNAVSNCGDGGSNRYGIEFLEKQEYIDNTDDYFQQEHEGLHIVVDKKNASYVEGLTIDWQDGFTFTVNGEETTNNSVMKSYRT